MTTEPSALALRLRGILKGPVPSPAWALSELEARPGTAPSSAVDGALDRALGGEWSDGVAGSCFVVERRFDAEASYGCARVGDLAASVRNGAGHASIVANGAPARPPFLFFDIETTGLGGGAGTYAFLVGCGRFDAGGGFVTRQYLMARYVDERPLLATVVETLRGAGGLVSFNGKAFDMPMVQMRCLFHRIDWTSVNLPHLDVLYPARRFWGGADAGRPSCSLAALEEHVLGARRVGDVPGAEIPARYFEFVRSGDARLLAAVLDHNRHDLLSLAGLTARLLQLVSAGARAAGDPREAVALGHLYRRASLVEAAREAYEWAAGAGATPDGVPSIDNTSTATAARVEALRALALLSRRARRYEEAAGWWRRLLDTRECPCHLEREAYEALAIHHEHRARDLVAARMLALRGLEGGSNLARIGAARHRVARIERKLAARATRLL